MSTKTSILLSDDNEHWYMEGMDGSIVMEFSSRHEILMRSNGGITLILRPNSALHKELNWIKFT